ncbi:hypothetical protein FRB90_012681 [Tulasnella sp. 427]|nr:hypothetical protein FRB90_012681 [Tulasnella sp. 427]
MQPKKSCFVKKHRYHPYPRPTVPRTEVEVNASLKEAFERRHKQNFEGPKAIAIHDAVTAIYVPGTETWKWEPENRGPLGAFDFPEEDVDDEGDAEEREEVVEMLLPTNGKKRQFEEESDEDVQTTAGEPVHEPPAKKPRRSQRLIERKNPGFTSDNNPTFEFTFTAPLPSSTSLSPPSSPTQSSSPSSTVTGVLPTESPSDDDVLMSNDEAQGSSRKARVTRRKARVQFAAPTGMHPVHGIKDSIHFHYRRLKPQSQATLKSKKKRIVKRKGPIWTPDQIKSAKAKKAEWEEMRRNKFEHETSLAEIRTRVADEEEGDPASEAWKDAVERYEAAYPQIDFGGVRAKHLRPAKMEVPARNRELTRMPKPTEPMRWWYPSWEHPAWDGIPREVLMDWTRSDHFKVRVAEVKNALSAEDEARAKRRRAMEMEMGERSDAETVVDETEDAMRRAFVAEGNEGEQVLPSPAPQTSTETSPLFVIPALKMTPDVEALWEARWSAPGALHSTAA